METAIWIEDWQMQCCGTSFQIGDTVKWTILKWEFEKPIVDVGEIDFLYENHAESNDNLFEIEGVVTQILAIHYVYELNTKTRAHIPISGITVPVNEADGWNEDINDEMEFAAYCVKLENVSIKSV